ncbi:MAG: hypothetical protein J6A05_05020 [Oscillospiraceae bacterium]|nr:hypothetical protein [Oscillospiraceae bacterium]
MKITAHFNSSVSADFAAGTLKRVLSPLTKIETENQSSFNTDVSINIFPVFNLSGVTPSYSTAVKTDTINDTKSDDSCVLKVICKKEEVAEAMRIIIGFGGRNITKI